MGRMTKYPDPYGEAQFSSLWAVVTHATEPDEDRWALYREAHASMVATKQWRAYRMVFSPVKGVHVGFRYANPKDWFTINDQTDEVDGPFDSKKIILRKHRLKRSKYLAAGLYSLEVDNLLAFTRDKARSVGVDEEILP